MLDFFVGSGTTGHAVLELNKQDEGNRQFILVTNNENKIAEEITYERVKRVMRGYKNLNTGEKIAGLAVVLLIIRHLLWVQNQQMQTRKHCLPKRLKCSVSVKEHLNW